MSVLEFISSLKWPAVVLVMLAWISRALSKHPGTVTWVKEWLNHRNINAKFPGAEITTSDAQPAAAAVTATDEDLPAGQAQTIRQEAAEQLMRQAALWGWHAHRAGSDIPVPQIEMRGDQPVISFSNTFGPPPPEQRHRNLLQNWYRQQQGGE